MRQSGFTLIELMIVAAIVAILSAIAIPAYHDYIARTQVSEAAILSTGLKSTITDAWLQQGRLTGINSGTHGLPTAAAVKGRYVRQVSVSDGLIEVTLKSQGVASPLTGKTLILSPTSHAGALAWTCKAGTLDPRYMPRPCQ